jgi:methyl-accepting chemotaxis protein
MKNLIQFQNNEATKWSKEAEKTGDLATQISLIILIAFLFIGIVIGTLLAKGLTNLLTKVISDLNTNTPQLKQAATRMSSVSTQLSASATEQAAAVQETASSLEEISAMIKRNSDNAISAKNISEESLHSVQEGQKAVEDMLLAMNDINQNSSSFNSFIHKNNEELEEIVKVIKEIADKTKVINDIVFQTKLLSFNASVEAARAGEQGKGFSVVAEVGNLAAMSGSAANEISDMLNKSIQKVDQIVIATKSQVEVLINDGSKKINTGVKRTEKCKESLDKIQQSVLEVSSLVAEISNATSEQSQGIQEVNKAMGQVDESTNQNASASQDVSATAIQVTKLVGGMSETIAQLLVIVDGEKMRH